MKAISALVALVLLVIVGSAQAGEKVINTVSSEPPIVETWKLEPVWVLSGDDETAPLIGRVGEAEVNKDGQVLLLDSQIGRVVVLAADGSLDGLVGRKGEGPGELENPSGIFLFSDGTLGMAQFYPKKTVRLNMDGTPRDPIPADSLMGVYLQVRAANDHFVFSSQEMDSKNTTKFISTYNHSINRRSISGEVQYTYLKKTIKTSMRPPKFDEAASYFPAKVWDLTKEGTLLLAPDRDLYRIEFLSPDGELQCVIDRKFTPYSRSDDELEALKSKRVFRIGDRKIPVDCSLEKCDPAIKQIQVHFDGSIWVSSCYAGRDLPDGIFRRFDVFEATGDWRSTIHILVDGDLEKDKLISLRDDRFLLVKNYQQALSDFIDDKSDENEDILEIVCFRRTES